eukprot:scaffold666_cov17-Tisochrysis_lutea.AAC.2
MCVRACKEGLRVGQEGQEDVVFEAGEGFEEEGEGSGGTQDDDAKEETIGEAEIPEVEGFEGYAAEEEVCTQQSATALKSCIRNRELHATWKFK